MKKIIEFLVRKLRNQEDYVIKGNYSSYEFLLILYYRGFQIFRGFWQFPFSGKVKGLKFIGRHVKIEHSNLFSSGSNLILDDGVSINALSMNGIIFGRNVNIGKNTIIICSGVIANKGAGLTIGNHSAIGAQSFIGAQGGVIIGDDVIFGPGVKIFSENHEYKDSIIPIRLQGEIRSGVRIGNNCWIGAGVTILAGVSIGNGCVIAAGSIVTKDVPSNTLYYNKLTAILKNRLDENSNSRD